MPWTVLPLMLLVWTGASIWVAHRLSTGSNGGHPAGLADSALRAAWQVLLLAVLIPLPVLDELVAQAQFATLCREQLRIQLQPGVSAAADIHLDVSAPERVGATMVPVSRREHRYTDSATQQTRLQFSTYQAHAGKLARMAGHPDVPLTFEGWCSPPDPQALLAQAGVRREASPQRGGLAPAP